MVLFFQLLQELALIRESIRERDEVIRERDEVIRERDEVIRELHTDNARISDELDHAKQVSGQIFLDYHLRSTIQCHESGPFILWNKVAVCVPIWHTGMVSGLKWLTSLTTGKSARSMAVGSMCQVNAPVQLSVVVSAVTVFRLVDYPRLHIADGKTVKF